MMSCRTLTDPSGMQSCSNGRPTRDKNTTETFVDEKYKGIVDQENRSKHTTETRKSKETWSKRENRREGLAQRAYSCPIEDIKMPRENLRLIYYDRIILGMKALIYETYRTEAPNCSGIHLQKRTHTTWRKGEQRKQLQQQRAMMR